MGLLGKLSQITLLGVVTMAIAVVAAAQAKENCANRCGNVSIPYPFGMEEGCYLDENFMVTCVRQKPKLGNISVEGIWLETHELRGSQIVARDCYKNQSGQLVRENNDSSIPGAPQFTISGPKNKLTVLGCDTSGYLHGFLQGKQYQIGCSTKCPGLSNVVNGSCSGVGCCQVEIPDGLTNVSVNVSSFNNHSEVLGFNPCGYAFAVTKDRFNFSSDYFGLLNETVPEFPVVLQWAVAMKRVEMRRTKRLSYVRVTQVTAKTPTADTGTVACVSRVTEGTHTSLWVVAKVKDDIDECSENLHNCTKQEKCHNLEGSYECRCRNWFKPNRKEGRRGCVLSPALTATISIVTGVGFVATLRVSCRLYLGHQKRNKRKFYDQNGGSDLETELPDQAKIFTVEELKKATKNFHKSRIIGPGGFGSFDKGILPDGTTVAIKKSKAVNQSQKEQFVKEVVALSQISHRNIVKLLGCCLEIVVPLLVYEFISNDTLLEYIHNGSKPSPISDMGNPPEEGLWKTRIKIATEVAEALSELHSADSKPIIHRNVKSANILLKHDITTNDIIAKVSNFGISRLFPQHPKELVQETHGYLDPEYLQTNQLTEKSDVYNFGVVLAELLTGKEAFLKDSSEDERSLVRYFLSYLEHDQLFEVLDKGIVEEGNEEQINKVVELAESCLKVKGDERPNTEEVATELESIRKTKVDPSDDPQSIEQEPKQSPSEIEERNEDDGSGS